MTTKVSSGSIVRKLLKIRHRLFEQKSAPVAMSLAAQFLFDMGIGRVRCYEAVYDSRTDKFSLVLRAAKGMPKDESEYIGYVIEEGAATVGKDPKWSKPLHDTYRDAFKDRKKRDWLTFLVLENRQWWDFPITIGDQKLGIIAFDYDESDPKLAASYISVISEIAQILGYAMELIERRARALGIERTKSKLNRDSQISELLSIALDNIRDIVGGCTAAAFKLQPTTMSLIRLTTSTDLSCTTQLESIDEQYKLGQYLTGLAWGNPRYRSIVDFEDIQRTESEILYAPSMEYHSRLIKELKSSGRPPSLSVLYSRSSVSDMPTMIRLIARRDDPRLPFAPSHKELLDALVTVAMDRISDRMHEQLIASYGELASVLQETPDNVGQIAAKIRQLTETYGVMSFAVWHKTPVSDKLKVEMLTGEPLTLALTNTDSLWSTDPLLQIILKQHYPRVLIEGEKDANGVLWKKLKEASISHLFIYPFPGNSEVQGAFCAVLGTVNEEFKEMVTKYWESNPLAMATLRAVGSLVGAALEASRTSIRVDAARRVYASIGHEFRRPVQALQSQAVYAHTVASRLAATQDDATRTGLEKCKKNIFGLVRSLNRAVQNAFQVGRLMTSAVEYDYKMFRLADLLATCEDLLKDICIELGAGFVVYDSAKRLPPITADRDSIQEVLLNIMENGVKYSYGHGDGKPKYVEVRGRSDAKFIYIEVMNWGKGIRESDNERIFSGLYRTLERDEQRAVAGIGMGLSIARQITRHHGGDINVVSIPTLQDPIRTERLEGFKTTFCIKLPISQKIGQHTVLAKGGIE